MGPDVHSLSLGRVLRRGLSAVAVASLLALMIADPASAQSTNGGGGRGTSGGSRGGMGGSGGNWSPAGAVILPTGPSYREYIDRAPSGREYIDDEPVRRRHRVVARARTNEPSGDPRIVMPAPGEDRLVAGEVLVELRKGVRIGPIAQRLRLEIVASTTLALTGTEIHRLRARGGVATTAVLRGLGSERGVAFAQPDYVHALQQDAAAATPPPPPALPGQYAGEKLALGAAHARATGRGVTIGVVDTAVDGRHPDLGGAIVESFDAIGGGAEQPAGHGTAMAGAIAAHGRLVGTAPGARLVVARAFGDPAAAKGSQGTSFHVLGGLDWVVTKGARVVSLSFAGPHDELLKRTLTAARGRGVIVVAAAGNAGPSSPPLYPAAEPGVIAVTASDGDDRIYAGANRGRHIAVTAPGVDVLVAAPRGGYDLSTGTSVAAAEVAGVVALMLEAHADLGEAELRRRLQASARDLGEPGVDPVFGAGLVEASVAVK